MNNKDYRAWYEDELNEKIKQLEEENKKLNENVERYKKHYLAEEEYLECQDSAIKKLKKDLAYERTMLDNVKAEYENLQEINGKLNERIKELEERLDNKEKVNKSLREGLERYKKQYEHTMGED